ncbi:MAG: hypothetical protein JWR75_285 [Devosia sp.]|nr:hypothetical protein [Devosia sp.]
MRFSLPTFKTTARAAMIAVALGATTLAAAPAQAGSSPLGGFSIQFGTGGGGNFGFGFDGGSKYHHDDYEPDYSECLTNSQIRKGLQKYGFHNVQIGNELNGQRVRVYAQYGNWIYKLRVDRCNGRVDQIQKYKKAGGNNGFEFEMNF